MDHSRETVILLHGIGHIGLNMVACERVLRRQGYQTHNLTYPSLRRNINDLAEWLAEKIEQADIWTNSDKVHFVVHSMGGLVSGFYLENYKDAVPKEKMGRVVMLGTPHGGSEVADFLHKNPLYKWVFGPAGQELTTMAREHQKIKPWYELGIIAGAPEKNFTLGALFINSPHDGVVSVDSTRIEGMKDHRTMPVFHTLLAWTPKVQDQINHFLEEGTFA